METFVLIGLWVLGAAMFLTIFVNLSERKPITAAVNALSVVVNAGAIALINGWL